MTLLEAIEILAEYIEVQCVFVPDEVTEAIARLLEHKRQIDERYRRTKEVFK